MRLSVVLAILSAAFFASAVLTASAAAADDPHALFMASAFEAPKKGACEVLSPDPGYVNEMLVRFNADGSKAAPEKRVALVIGNGAYEAFPDLKNPANDAAAVARLLRGLGFAVWRGVDLTSASAGACLADFYRRGAEGAHVALLYYAGHGVSAGGVNALLPVDASFTDASESALNNALPVDAILAEMRKRAISSLLFLDACRSSLGRGFAAIRPEGSSGGAGAQRQTKVAPRSDSGGGSAPALGGFYYVYAAAPNATAADGDGEHSPFTRAFLDNAATPGELVQELVVDITRDVIRAAQQSPFADGSLTEDVYLNGEMTDREMASRSDSFAAQSASFRENGLRGDAIAAALKGMPKNWSTGDAARVFGRARAQLAKSNQSASLTLKGHLGVVNSAVFSPDMKRILTASGDQTARVWDSQTGKAIKSFRHTDNVENANFSPDGRHIVTASDDDTAHVWDAATGERVLALVGHKGDVTRAAFSPDGRRIVTASTDNTARIWDAVTGKRLFSLVGHAGSVNDSDFSPAGHRIVTASDDHTAKIWNAVDGTLVRTLAEHSKSVNSAGFGAGGARVVTASDDFTVKVWDTESGAVIRTLQDVYPLGASFSPDGKKIVTAGPTVARLWDPGTGAEILPPLVGHTVSVIAAAFSPDGNSVVTASGDGTARVWDLASGKSALDLVGTFVAFSPDGTHIATACVDRTARVWDAVTGRNELTLTGHSGGILSIAYSHDGSRIVSTSLDRTARIWDALTGDALMVLSANKDVVADADFSPDDQYVVTASSDDTVRVWDSKTGELTAKWAVPYASAVAFSPDGNRIVIGSYDDVVILDAKTGTKLLLLKGHRGFVTATQFSSDGALVLTASENATARVFDAATGEEISALVGHASAVTDAAFNATGEWVITSSDDQTARIWDAATGNEIEVFRDSTRLFGVAVSPRGRRFATGAFNGQAKVWDAGLYGPELLDAAYDLLTDDLRAEVERERIRYWEVDPALLK